MICHIECDKGTGYVVDEPIPYMIDGCVRFVPSGYVSDGASVPKIFWWFISPKDIRCLYAGLCHDAIYDEKCVTRRVADAWMRRALIQDGFPRCKAWIAWAAVRLWGWTHW